MPLALVRGQGSAANLQCHVSALSKRVRYRPDFARAPSHHLWLLGCCPLTRRGGAQLALLQSAARAIGTARRCRRMPARPGDTACASASTAPPRPAGCTKPRVSSPPPFGRPGRAGGAGSAARRPIPGGRRTAAGCRPARSVAAPGRPSAPRCSMPICATSPPCPRRRSRRR
jgi:hypothetical protein